MEDTTEEEVVDQFLSMEWAETDANLPEAENQTGSYKARPPQVTTPLTDMIQKLCEMLRCSYPEAQAWIKLHAHPDISRRKNYSNWLSHLANGNRWAELAGKFTEDLDNWETNLIQTWQICSKKE